MSFFHQNIEFLRKKKRLSQKELADRYGIKQTSYSRWEKGTETKYDILIDLADFYDVTIDDLLCSDIQKGGLTKKSEKAASLPAAEKDKMTLALGKKELELMDRNEKLNFLSDLMIRFGKLLSQLPIMQKNGGEKLKALEAMLEEGLRKVEE